MPSKSPKVQTKKTSKKDVVASEPKPETSQPANGASKKAVEPQPAATAKPAIGTHPKVQMDQVFRASKALKTHTRNLLSKPGAKMQLIAQETPITVEILLHKVPIKGNLKRKIIPLAKSTRNPETTEICVFVRDSKTAKHKLQLASAPNIKKVIDLAKLRTHYNQYEARRTLAQSYDLFLCEDTILPDVCRQLGSSFLRIRKAPVAVKINSKAADTIAAIRDAALFDLSAGVTQSYKIGDTGFTEEDLCKNFRVSIDAVVKLLPLGWDNIKQIALISTGSAPLPVYNSLTPPAAKVVAEKPAEEKETTAKKPAREAKGKRPAPSAVEEIVEAPSSKKVMVSENGKAVSKKTESTPVKTPTKSAPVAEESSAPSSSKKSAAPSSTKKKAAPAEETPKEETPKKATAAAKATTPKSASKAPAEKEAEPTKKASATPKKSAAETPKKSTTETPKKESAKDATPATKSTKAAAPATPKDTSSSATDAGKKTPKSTPAAKKEEKSPKEKASTPKATGRTSTPRSAKK